MNKTHQYFFVAVHAFFIRNGKVLLCERANTNYMDGWLSVPAGHVDGNETIWQAMQREIQEEIGIRIEKEQQPTHVMHRVKHGAQEERIDYFFVITDWEGKAQNCEPEKCASVQWHTLSELPEKIIPYVRFALERIQEKEVFSEFEE